VRPNLGSLPCVSELQARYLSAYLSKKISLPSQATMQKSIFYTISKYLKKINAIVWVKPLNPWPKTLYSYDNQQCAIHAQNQQEIAIFSKEIRGSISSPNKLYKYIFMPKTNNCYFIGFVRPNLGSLPCVSLR
jgi:hypothetical protein